MSTGLEQLYQQIILDHAKARHGSPLADYDGDGRVGESHQLNPVCGDEITLRAAVLDGSVAAVTWDGAGCAISMASASVLTDLVQGVPRDEAITAVKEAIRKTYGRRGAEVVGVPHAIGGMLVVAQIDQRQIRQARGELRPAAVGA